MVVIEAIINKQTWKKHRKNAYLQRSADCLFPVD